MGEEGEPSLTITKEINVKIANPGDVLNYSVLITNNGNLDAFDVILTDDLAEGFVFVENEARTYSWELGDIPAGESRDAHYQVSVLGTATVGNYDNTVVASALNHDDVSAVASVEVIVPEVLAATGFDFKELMLLISLLLIIITGVNVLSDIKKSV